MGVEMIKTFCRLLTLAACLAGPAISEAADVVMIVEAGGVVRQIPPGAVGWGAMWKRQFLWPAPPRDLQSDAQHAAYIEHLAQAGAQVAQQADLRNFSWPWGVSFSTWGVNWENSARRGRNGHRTALGFC